MKKEFKELADIAIKLSTELSQINKMMGDLILAIEKCQPHVNYLDLFVMSHFKLDETKMVFVSSLVDYIQKHYHEPISAKSISHSMSRCGFKSHVVRINGKSFRVYYIKKGFAMPTI